MIDRSVPVALVRVRSIEEEARGERKEYEGTGRSHHPWENQESSFLLDLRNFTLMCDMFWGLRKMGKGRLSWYTHGPTYVSKLGLTAGVDLLKSSHDSRSQIF